MDKLRTMPRLCFLSTAAVTLIGTALRSVCMLTQLDAEVGYFKSGIPATLSSIFYFLAVALVIITATRVSKHSLATTLDTRLRLPAAFLWGAALAVFTVGVFLLCYADRKNNLLTAPMILGILSSLYFFISGDRSGRYPDWLSLLGFLPVLWCVAAVGETYVDQFTAMNSPIKVGLQLGFLGLALILISELRFRLGKPLPRVAVTFMGIGSYLALCGSVPVLLGTGAMILSNKLHLFYAIVLLCGGLYGLYTLFQYTWFPAEEESEWEDAEESPYVPADNPENPNAE
jgi:hypothetical protein